jgi:hypothetical protein
LLNILNPDPLLQDILLISSEAFLGGMNIGPLKTFRLSRIAPAHGSENGAMILEALLGTAGHQQ